MRSGGTSLLIYAFIPDPRQMATTKGSSEPEIIRVGSFEKRSFNAFSNSGSEMSGRPGSSSITDRVSAAFDCLSKNAKASWLLLAVTTSASGNPTLNRPPSACLKSGWSSTIRMKDSLLIGQILLSFFPPGYCPKGNVACSGTQRYIYFSITAACLGDHGYPNKFSASSEPRVDCRP